MSEAIAGEPRPGLRERGKRERLQRLHQAAADVFRTRGYDNATTRDIAQLAQVSVGTLFVYAKDKRDLLFLVINDDLDECLRAALAESSRPGPIVERLGELLRPIYTYFAAEPKLARPALREVVYYDRPGDATGGQALRYLNRMHAWQDAIAAALMRAAAEKQLRLDVAADLLARILFDIHLVEVRRWMEAAIPDPKTGTATLREMFTAVLGPRLLAPATAPRRSPRTTRMP